MAGYVRRGRNAVGALFRQGDGKETMAQTAKRLSQETAIGRGLKAHPKLGATGGLMGAGAITSRRRGRGTDRTRGVPRGIYRN